jgi:hypothetical protein
VTTKTKQHAILTIASLSDIDRLMDLIVASAARSQRWMAAQTSDPLELFRRMKFDPIGSHPVEDQKLNLVEQINQTWNYVAALAATRILLERHPNPGVFGLAPEGQASLALNIMSLDGLVGAKTFAAVNPNDNGKLAADLAKLALHSAVPHRYVFFMSPLFPSTQRHPDLEIDGTEVWSVDIPPRLS